MIGGLFPTNIASFGGCLTSGLIRLNMSPLVAERTLVKRLSICIRQIKDSQC
jgi:hypothetical protein